MTPDKRADKWDRVRLVLLSVISTVWVGNTVASAFIREYTPDPTIGAVMMLVAGYLFVIKGRSNRDE